MKKIFKALSILVATAAVGGCIAMTAGCSTGTNGTYTGEYHYMSKYGPTYGMVVEVTVENNIITNIKNITNTEASKDIQTYKDKKSDGTYTDESYHEWHTVSDGWEVYYQGASWLWTDVDANGNKVPSDPMPEPSDIGQSYGWFNADVAKWESHTSWLLQQYVGWSVADVLAIDVYTDYAYMIGPNNAWGQPTYVVDTDTKGEPYGTAGGWNANLSESGLLISGATQGSGRLILAVQDALSK